MAVDIQNLDKVEAVYISDKEANDFQGEREIAMAKADSKLTPTREFSIIVTKEGYYPNHLSLFQGEKVRLFVTNLTDEPACVIVAGHELFLSAEKGKITEAESVFPKAGTFPFYCPSTKHNGKISVIEIKKKVAERKIASESQVVEGPWIPKEN